VSGNGVDVVFVEAQRAVTPGQSIVFYEGDEMIGGGIIEKCLP
jgi:tRNA-specific 2-thiouridylase